MPGTNTLTWAIVTRPAPDHVVLIEAAQALGLRALHVPVHVLEPRPDRWRVAALLDSFDLAIVTSPATSRFLLEVRSVESLRHLTLLAPGPGTAAPLRAVGLNVFCPTGDGTSEAVLKLPQLASIAESGVAILGAPGGRLKIAAELERRGAQVRRMHLYRRRTVLPDPRLFEALSSAGAVLVIVSSVQIVNVLSASIPPECRDAWKNSVFIASSSRVEQSCRAHGLEHVVRARGASAADLLEGLQRALEQRHPKPRAIAQD